jgi:amino acid adenylation domain-containing protein
MDSRTAPPDETTTVKPRVKPRAIQCLHELVEAQADRAPGALAVSYPGASLTYAELERRANRLAHKLRRMGVACDTRVGVCAERSPEMLVGLLGVLKAGGAYVPLDPDHPRQRLALVLDEVRPPVVLVQGRCAEVLPAGTPVLALEEVPEECDGRPSPVALPSSLAYVIYTSGSTGRPKGVMVSHAAIANHLQSTQELYPASASDVFLQITPYSFDASIWELFLSLHAGARLVMALPGGHQDPSYLTRTVASEGVTVLQVVPSMLAALLDDPGLAACGSLRRIACGGEALPGSLAAKVFERLDVELLNLYGPTECAIDATTRRCRRGESHGTVPIGLPLTNVRVHVLDEHLQPVPPESPGGLYVGGACLARGYLDRPDLTAERFVPDPWSPVPGERLYRTGDLSRRSPGGEIEYLGRMDDQVKIRGFRIELGEIEAALERHPTVERAVVTSYGEAEDKRLVAYAVAASGAEVAESRELRAFLAEELPEYMVPASFVRLAAFPLNANGKIDRRALPPPAPEEPATVDLERPRTPLEEVVAATWDAVLRAERGAERGSERIGLHDSFFEHGGHSLKAVQILSRLRDALGIALPLQDFLAEPTIEGLARRIDAALAAGEGTVEPPLVPVPRDRPLPLSYAQQSLWFLSQLAPDSPFYSIPLALELRGPLAADLLARSLEEIERRHEALRTSFTTLDGSPVQVIREAGPVALPCCDLSGLAGPAGEQREQEAARLLLAEALVPFDLAGGPLLRAHLLRLGRERHILLLVVHHIVSDGWSIDILLAELTALYGAFAAGRPSPLPELPLQYADFAVWQRGLLTSQSFAATLAYWKARLDGAPPLQDLPGDRPRPAVQSYRGAAHGFHLPAPLCQDLKALAVDHGSTLFMALLAALDVLLLRLSGREDLVVGSAVAKRSRSELEGLIGLFVNMLPLRTQVDPEGGFHAVLGAVRETALAAYTHQDLPFEVLVEELAPERDLSRNPLFQIALVFEGELPGEIALAPDLTLTYGEVDGKTSQFDLTLHLSNRDGGLAGRFVYSTDLFDDDTVVRMAGQLERLLAGLVAEPERAVATLPLLTAEERQRVLVDWNRTATDYPREESVPALFEQVAASAPDRIALTCGEESLTYGELNRRANQLAHTLRGLGVGPDRLVGLMLDRSPDMMVATLGILKAGGAYLPLDPGYPAERLDLMLRDARPTVLLSEAGLAARLPESDAHLLCLDRDRDRIAAHSPESPGVALDPLNLVYVMYTSGSTGRPKGVAAVHRGVVRLVRRNDFADLGADRVFLQFSPVSFDASTLEIWGPLLNGGRLVLMPPGHASLEDIARVVRDQGVDTLWLTAGLFHLMVQERLGGLAPLRQLIAGGDALSAAHVEQVLRELPGCRMINGYGPTESTTFTCCATLGLDLLRGRGSVPIGRPIANTRVYLLDRRLEPVPPGVPGELYIGGDGLVRGYHARPDLTAERFVPHPHAELPGERLYRTGDLAAFRAGGVIEFLGRTDQQVKVRGFRIELGEIEAALGRAPGVKEATVVARQESPGGERRLVAYVVLDDSGAGSLAELREFLQQGLPDYMVPASFVFLPALPLDPNGKVDRRSLPAPEPEEPAALALPRTPHEEVVAAIWSSVLGREEIGIHDSFFDLGGNSLIAIQVVSRLRDALGVDLPVRTLFEQPTIAKLAHKAGAVLAAERAVAVPPLVAVPRDRPLPLSPAQQGLWVLAQLAPDSPFYNVPTALELAGPLDPALLARSLDELVRRHEALRTTFQFVAGEAVQVVEAAATVPLPCFELNGLSAPERELEAARLVLAEAVTPFDLSRGPLLRVLLLRHDAESHTLVLNLHHIISDGWSVGVLLAELTVLYRAFAAGKPSPLPEPPLQYADFAAWQRRLLEEGFLAAPLAHWKAQLAGAPPLQDLPGDRPRPAVQSFRGASHLFHLPAPLWGEMKTFAHSQGSTLFMAAFAAFNVLLLRLSGRTDLSVGTPVANRSHSALEELVGFFVNMLPLRTQVDPDGGFRALLAAVRDMALAAYAHQELPFEVLVAELAPERDLSRNPLFQIAFSLESVEIDRTLTEGLVLRRREIDWRTSHFDLTLLLENHGGEIVGRLAHSTDLFDAATIARMAGQFERLLSGVIAEPERPLAALTLLSAEERRQLLVDWNRTTTDYPREESVASVFAAIAAAAPERVALVGVEESVTYGELERRANRLARALRDLGVGSDHRVALLLERSIDMVVATLGILKAGGAYVPLEPSYPRERLALMLREARPTVLLTTSAFDGRLGETDSRLLCLDRDRERIAACSPEPLETGPDPLDVAYIMFTSGSTGTPKGVAVIHRGIVRLVRGIDYGDLGGDRVFLQLAPISFDASTFEIWAALLNGGRLVLMPPGPASLDDIARVVRDQGVDTLFLTAGLFHLMVQERLSALASLRQLLSGGDVLSTAHVERVLAELPGCRMVNAYGPTEGSVISTCHIPVPGEARRNGSVPIGRPIANTWVCLLDRLLEPVPPGIPGELYIGGDGLARGYHTRPDLTAERFVPHPHSELPGERLYRTGDFARFRSDGLIEFLGRADQQVKVRGFRIELGEIESNLNQAPGVKEVTVIARKERSGERQIVAYVVMEEGREGERPHEGLRAFLKERLPDYMVPASFVFLAEIPLDLNGKVDRRALPAPVDEDSEEETYTAPRTPTEETIAAIWAEVLGRERLGVHHDFFLQGGHSLSATRVASRLRETFGVDLPLALFFEARTIAELAQAVERSQLEQADRGELERLLAELEGASEDEIERLIQP